MAAKPKPDTSPSFEDRRCMSIPTFCDRNQMSKAEFNRRRVRQRLGEPGAEALLPPLIQIGPKRYGIRYGDERAWQESKLINAVTTGKRQRSAKAAA
jgi:hypothetical protein